MKKIIVFLILFNPLFLFGQYHRIVKDYAVWGMMFAHFEPDDPPASTIGYSYYIMYGDTTINNNSYKKVYEGLYKDTIKLQDYLFALREDSLGDVYIKCSLNYYLYNDTLEHLLYRFSLNSGDTLFGVNPNHPLFVQKIDSVLVNSTYRKRIEFRNFSIKKRIWIEGIGSTVGLAYPAKDPVVEFNQELICYHDSNTTWPSNAQCGGLGIVELEKISCKIYPNPTSKYLNFNISNSSNAEISINVFNVLGIEIKNLKTTKNSNVFSLDVSNFKTGIYFYQILSKDENVIHSGKFIKQ